MINIIKLIIKINLEINLRKNYINKLFLIFYHNLAIYLYRLVSYPVAARILKHNTAETQTTPLMAPAYVTSDILKLFLSKLILQ